MPANVSFNFSISEPKNESFFNPRDNDKEWEKFYTATQKVPQNIEIPMFIDGKKIYSDQKLNKINPSNGKTLATFQQANESHAKTSIQAALNAKTKWAALSPMTRIQKFRDLEVILNKWKYELCATEMVECGFTAYETYVEWAELMDFIRFNNYFYWDLLNEQLGDDAVESNSLCLRPLKGFTCAVTPFNFPLAIGYHLPLIMALTGNTVVWKPSDDAPLISYFLMLAIQEAGFPPGVINMITGDGAKCLPTVLTDPQLSALNFTGSLPTARVFGNYLYNTQYQRPNFPRYCAETGGKNFLVADADIDIQDTARAIVQGAFGRSGQKCSANSIIFADAKIWPALKAQLIKEAQQLNVCSPLEKQSDLGPVINQRQFDKIKLYIERAKADRNCEIFFGGTTTGLFIQPTFIEVSSTNDHQLFREEIFGPVSAVKVYHNFDEVLALIQSHQYRLTGSVISRNETFLADVVPILNEYAGNLYINRKTTGAIVHRQPFGGDASSGTNSKAGGKWYLLNFVSQSSLTRRHDRISTPTAFEKFAIS